MTPPMNISEPAVLKALLEKTKVKEIRKAWTRGIASKGEYIIFKDPKWKVGDVVEVIWTGEEDGPLMARVLNGDILGKVRITKVEKIEVLERGGIAEIKQENGLYMSHLSKIKLAELEGFESSHGMFYWMRKYSEGLEIPREFYVYSFEWIKEETQCKQTKKN